MRCFFLVSIAVCLFAGSASARYMKMITDNEKRLANATELIRLFETEREPERLRESSIELENVDLRRVNDKKVREDQRGRCLALWLTLVRSVDRNLDPSYDPDDSPPLKVDPPPLKDGTKLWPGADPKLIDDPKAREEYEKAIVANRERQEKVLFQSQLHELDQPLFDKAIAFIRRNYAENERDSVKVTIEKTIESESRKQLFDVALESRPIKKPDQ